MAHLVVVDDETLVRSVVRVQDGAASSATSGPRPEALASFAAAR